MTRRDWKVLGPKVEAVAREEIARGERGFVSRTADRLGIGRDDVTQYLGKRSSPEWRAFRQMPALTPLPEPVAEPEALPPEHPELRTLERKLRDARDENSGLRAKLKEADADRSVFEQLVDVLRAEVKPWEPVPLPAFTQFAGQFDVDAAVALTDEHADEVITGAATWGLERYNFDVFRIRLERYVKVIGAYLTQHLPRYHFERLWVHSLGDKLHGNLHLPGQKYRNHFANDLRAAIAVGEAEADAVAKLLQYVPQITLVCVSGNHPRQTAKKDFGDPHDNHDFLVAAMLEARLRNYVDEGRLQIYAPRAWSAYCEIRGRTHALNHGDDVQGTWGIPWYGFSKKEGRVQSLLARKDQRADFFWYGHYHTDVGVTENDARSIHAGAWTLTSDYSINRLAAGSEPSQPLEVLDDEHGRILEVPIYLRDANREAAYWRGEYRPTLGRSMTLERLALADALAETGAFPLIRATDSKGAAA